MPSPSSSLSTLRPEIAGSFMEFDLAMQQRGYIAHRVLPVFEAAKQSGIFGTIPLEQLLQNRDTKRAPGSGYSRGNFKFSTQSYACQEHGAEEPVDDREAKMYADYFDAEMVSAMRAFDAVLTNAEKRAAALIFNATTWTGASLTTGVTNEWDDFSNATPIDDVEAAVQKVWDNSGLWPNALVITKKVFRNLRNCSQVRDRLTGGGGYTESTLASVTEQDLARVFDLDQIIVGGSAKNTANEGQTASIAPVWDDEYAMICRVATSNDIKEPCIGRTFHWGEDGSEIGGMVESYRDETVRSDIIRVRHDVDEKVLYTQAGHLLSNITS